MNNEPPARSIRRQLTVRIIAGTLVMLCIAGSIFMAVIHQRLVKNFDNLLEVEAAMLSRNSERKGRTIIWDVPDTYSAGSRQNSDPAYCQLFLEDGTVVGLSQTLGTDDLPRLEGRRQAVWNATLPNGKRGRLIQKIYRPVSDDVETQFIPDDPHEQTHELAPALDPASVELVLVVARGREPLDLLLGSLYASGVAVAATLAGALAWLVRRAITRALRPIDEINAQISAIAPDALDTRLRISSPPVELATIEATVNRLLGRVEQAFARERQFSNNLAHELRTLIAELRTACEVGERWPDDPESTRLLFHDTRQISLQLEKVVGTMLMLSRSEARDSVLKIQRIHLQPLVRECWEHAMAGAEEMRLEFDQRIPPELTVECDEDKLELIVRNLVDNAVAHSEPGTVVGCDCAETIRGIEFRLVNTARDLQRDDLDHLFDRLWRKEESRTDRCHIGLGLSITRELCQMLGLQLRVDLKDDRLFEATLLFPPGT